MLRPRSTSLLIASLLAACGGGGGGGDTVGVCTPSASPASGVAAATNGQALKEVSENVGPVGAPAVYADTNSVAPGQMIGFHAAVMGDAAADVYMQIRRVEETTWLFGRDLGSVPGRTPGDNGWMDCCNWPLTYGFRVPDDWESGLYVAQFSTGVDVNEVFFVVRAKSPGTSRIVVSVPMTTAYAYNNWGGKSVYEYNSSSDARAQQLSLSRPFAGNSRDKFTAWLPYFINWARNQDTPVPLEFIANTDLHVHPGILDPYDLFVTVGHDEYWSAEMRAELERHLDAGGNAALFSGNNMWWKIRFGVPDEKAPLGRMLVDKDDEFEDGVDDPELHEGHWFMVDPESRLLGASYARGGYREDPDGDTPGFKVQDPGDWVFAGTGLAKDEEFGSENLIISFESDGADFEWDNTASGKVAVPTHTDGTPIGLKILAVAQLGNGWSNDYYDEGDSTHEAGKNLYTGVPGAWSTMVRYKHPGGGHVFNAATVDWSYGLSNCKGASPAVECVITRNVIDKLRISAKSLPGEPAPAPAPEPAPAPAPAPAPSPAPAPPDAPDC